MQTIRERLARIKPRKLRREIRSELREALKLQIDALTAVRKDILANERDGLGDMSKGSVKHVIDVVAAHRPLEFDCHPGTNIPDIPLGAGVVLSLT